MPRGDKSKYTDKQERKADHIAEGYEKRGVSEKEAPCGPQGRQKGRRRLRASFSGKSFHIGQEGCCDPQAQRRPSRPVNAAPPTESRFCAVLPVCRVALGIIWPVTSLRRLLWRGAEFRSIFCHSSPGGGVQKDFAVGLRNACAG